MSALRDYLARDWKPPTIRALGLTGPIIVLLIALPLLRPLRHPSDISNDEALRLATVRALVEHGTAAIDQTLPQHAPAGTIEHGGHSYSAQPPMLARLLAVPAWVMLKLGFTFEDNQLLIAYLLTVVGVALPVALAAGLIYRMGRLFELPRLWRAALSIAVVLGSGLISYSVVLNQHAPAAALLIASAGCLVHVAAVDRARHRWVWLMLSGLAAGFAATIDPPAALLGLLFLFVIPALRYPLAFRLGGVLVYLFAAALPLLLHARWNAPLTGGDWLPASISAPLRASVAPSTSAEEEEEAAAPSRWAVLARAGKSIAIVLFGGHGVVSHFPIVIIAVAGVFAVMHRHWPSATKVLAAATLASAVAIVLLCSLVGRPRAETMFASRWFIVFAPLLVYWLGAWVRQTHRPATWVLAAVLLSFSIVVALLGATGPSPADGLRGYTALAAAKRLFVSSPASGSVQQTRSAAGM